MVMVHQIFRIGLLVLICVFITMSALAEPLHDAVKNQDIKRIKELIEQGANVNAKNKDGETALHIIATEGYVPMVSFGQTQDSLQNNKVKKIMIELLIKNGADVNVKKNEGFTPLHMATLQGYKTAVELFITNGANVYAKDNAGKTPLDWAVLLYRVTGSSGHKEIIELLQQH